MTQTTIPKYWRSLDELDNSAEFQEFVHREFPVAASEFPAGVSRRRWMQLMGASFALASVAGCRWETEEIAPLLHRPEGYIPGKPQKYATTIELAGAPRHLLVTCYDGRPIKIEGNPEHPSSLGATDVYSQASTLTLYDPDRSSAVRERLNNEIVPHDWDEFSSYAKKLIDKLRAASGDGLAVLLEPSSSLAQASVIGKFTAALPQAKLYEYAPLARENELAGAEMAFGERVRTHYKLAGAKVIASFDGDLLCSHPNSTRYARDFASTRELDNDHPAEATMSRLYAIESQFSTTGAAADHRAAIKSGDIGAALASVRDQIQQRLDGGTPDEPEAIAERPKIIEKNAHVKEGEEKEKLPPVTADQVLWALADDLASHVGESVVAVGPRQPAEVHALAYEVNAMLGNLGKTVVFTEHPASTHGTIGELATAIESSEINALVIIGGNPAYDAPADLNFAAKIEKVLDTIRLGYYEDETSGACQWHLPMCHPLETWGDAVSYEGVPSVAQPLIEPIYDSRSSLQLLGQLAGIDNAEPEVLVREAFSAALAEPLNKSTWSQLLHDGFVDTSLLGVANPSLASDLDIQLTPANPGEEIVFCPSTSTYDGRFANNGWLQETPDFITKVTWDNVAIVSPKTAERRDVKQNELMKITLGEVSLELPVYVLPGQANDSIGVQLGYGRTAAGVVGGLRIPRFRRYWLGEKEDVEVGVDVYPMRNSDAMHIATGVKLAATGKEYKLATTQDHFAIDKAGLELTKGRIGELVREGTLDEYHQHPDFATHRVHEIDTPPLWDDKTWRDRPNAWGMAVDLNKCIGCNGCVVACQAENNVPVVGKEQVMAGREMHWIRIDRYFSGMPEDFNDEDPESPQVSTQMVTCQQCETAPCEQVCPVAATVHSDEGLNDMVYNRCVGTRYCANNCPYKVRRFNYFHMTGYIEQPENKLIQLAMNPEVTVRSRGVMEKCTYCTQRISAARVDARITKEPISDGSIQTACQQVCPTGAIEFGDLNDKDSRVSEAHANKRAYGMLAELDTRPRTKYLAKVRNPHPALAPPVMESHGGEHGHEAELHEHETNA
ncbi:MAG: TAT-variant-translocated molybdopterin oxidoreductase [Aeoliella sp.]